MSRKLRRIRVKLQIRCGPGESLNHHPISPLYPLQCIIKSFFSNYSTLLNQACQIEGFYYIVAPDLACRIEPTSDKSTFGDEKPNQKHHEICSLSQMSPSPSPRRVCQNRSHRFRIEDSRARVIHHPRYCMYSGGLVATKTNGTHAGRTRAKPLSRPDAPRAHMRCDARGCAVRETARATRPFGVGGSGPRETAACRL
jgi:hypothetical protein